MAAGDTDDEGDDSDDSSPSMTPSTRSADESAARSCVMHVSNLVMKFMLGLSEKHRVYNRSSFPRPEDAPASQKSGVVSAPLKRAFKAGKDLVKRVRKMSS